MNKELLCIWLGLPKTAWPPDPWTLLGLTRDVCDMGLIEKRVQECMCKLRSYQLSYPEEATEGMNRLAEAFITLTESCTKQTHAPASSNGSAAAKAKANGATVVKDETEVTTKTKLDWRAEPPPVRQEAAAPPPTLEVVSVTDEAAEPDEPVAEEESGDEVLVAKPFAPPAKLIRRTIDRVLLQELAEQSDEATSNLATLEAVIERVDHTRALLHAWERVGKLLKGTSRKVGAKENDAYATRLDKIALAMQSYPPFLGQPGKPGYRVVVQARLRMPLAMVRGMNPEQREELLFDWQAGRELLLAHRKYLHRLFKSMRHRTKIGLAWHAVRSVVNDHPLLTLAGAAFVFLLVLGFVLARRS